MYFKLIKNYDFLYLLNKVFLLEKVLVIGVDI